MILLDTNVISALMQREPDPAVVSWLDGLPSESVWTTSITVFEVRFGLEVLAPGRRRRSLQDAFDALIEEDLDNRVAPFDGKAGAESARVSAVQRGAGSPVEIRDVFIAGIASTRNATLATRNIKHFHGLGLTLVDPWSPA